MRHFLFIFLGFFAVPAYGQQALLQGGAQTSGRVPMYQQSGTGQPVVLNSGPASGTVVGQGISEINITARGTGTAPYASQGSGPNGEIACVADAVSANATGGHQLCFSANAAGGGLISYGAFGTATALPFNFKVNNTTYAFPFVTGGIVGPSTTVVNDTACWNNTVGTLLKDCGPQLTIGGSSGQVQYNNAGSLGGFTVSGDGTLNTGTGALTVTKAGGQNISLGGALTTGGAVTFSGAFSTTFTVGSGTSLALPSTGTLSTLAGSEAFTNKTYNGNSWTSGTGTLTIANGKTLTASNTLTFAGTDGSTLNVGTGGTLGTAAFTAATAYMPSGVQATNSLPGDVNLSNTSNYFDGPSVSQGATGTWFCSGSATVVDTAGGASFSAKLWDGTTVVDSGLVGTTSTNQTAIIALSGYLATPAANMRISVKDSTSTSGVIKFNASGNSKDSSLSCFRVQ